MSKTPWQTDKWFTSPWNFEEQTISSIQFADKIKFHDVTLRDGEQQAGLIFSKEQKVVLAEKLAEAGIHRIEAGMPAVSAQDKEAIKEIVKRNLGPEIFAFARCVKEDVKQAADVGVTGVIIEIPSSQHMIEYAYKWELEKAIELSIEATAYAKELGLYTVFFPIDMTRADINWVLDLVSRVAKEGHMDALSIVDTFGGLNTHSIPYLIKKTKEHINKPIEVHFHDDFGLGTANTIMALACGADVAHTTVSAIGERAGNTSYEEVALSLLTMYGKDTGLKYENFYSISKYLRKITGLNIRSNRAIIGETLNDIESGIVTGWYSNCKENHPLELSPYLPTLTGHPASKVVLGKFSGLSSIEVALEQIGVKVESKDIKDEILIKLKEEAFKTMDLIPLDNFREIVAKIVG